MKLKNKEKTEIDKILTNAFLIWEKDKNTNKHFVGSYIYPHLLNLDTGEFLYDRDRSLIEDVEKKEFLFKELVTNHVPLDGLGYPYASINAIVLSYLIVYEHKATDMGPLKISHSDVLRLLASTITDDNDKVSAYYRALSYGVDILADIENVANYDAPVLKAVAYAAMNGINVCDRIKPGITGDDVIQLVNQK